MTDYSTLASMLQALSGDSLTAFIVWAVLDTLKFIMFVSLCTWGIRTLWKALVEGEA